MNLNKTAGLFGWLASKLSSGSKGNAKEERPQYEGKFNDVLVNVSADDPSIREIQKITAKNRLRAKLRKQIERVLETDKNWWPKDVASKHIHLGGVTRYNIIGKSPHTEYWLNLYDDRKEADPPEDQLGHNLIWHPTNPDTLEWYG